MDATKPAVLIERLEALNTISDGAVLALWRPADGTTTFISAGVDRAGLEALTSDFLPVAFIWVRRENDRLHMAVTPVDSDFDDEPGMSAFLQSLAALFRAELAKDGVVRRPTVQ